MKKEMISAALSISWLSPMAVHASDPSDKCGQFESVGGGLNEQNLDRDICSYLQRNRELINEEAAIKGLRPNQQDFESMDKWGQKMHEWGGKMQVWGKNMSDNGRLLRSIAERYDTLSQKEQEILQKKYPDLKLGVSRSADGQNVNFACH